MSDCDLRGSGKHHLSTMVKMRWEKVNGPVPEGKQLNHTCDRINCVNIEHVYVGTQLDNMRDRKNRNGEWKGNRRGETCPHGHPWTTENTIVGKDGKWRCRECKNIAGRAYMRNKRNGAAA